jgi:predicted  nucleic acid-binding Zn-ribbon protein
MGLKDLFIEKEETEDDIALSALAAGIDNLNSLQPEVEVADVDTSDNENVVTEIYVANNLDNLNKSIFKVEDLMKTLPSEMPTASKRTTVESIMTTVGLDVADAVSDGENRIEILNASLNKTTSTINGDIATAEEKIEQLKLEIANNEKLIADSKATIKEFTEDINTETERIEGLIKFIKGE